MSREGSKLSTFDESIANFESEDCAINFLAALPEKVAAITAVKTAESLARTWDLEKEKMLHGGDQRFVYLSRVEERNWLAGAVAKYSQDSLWQSCSEECLRGLLAGLPSDAAAFIAYKVAKYVCCHARLLWRRR